jgi:hypothetical protein
LPVTNSIAKCGKTMIACASMLASRSRVLVGRCVYSACGNGAGSAASIVAMCSAVSRRVAKSRYVAFRRELERHVPPPFSRQKPSTEACSGTGKSPDRPCARRNCQPLFC